VDLLGRAAEVAALSGATDDAIGLLEQALGELVWTVEPVRAAVLLGHQGFHRFRAGAEADALAAYQEAERLLAGAPPSAERARVLAGHGLALMLAFRTREAVPVCQEAIAVARAVGAGAEEADALDSLACCLTDLSDLERSILLHLEARRLAEAAGADETMLRTYVNRTVSLELAGREREGTDDAAEGVGLANSAWSAPGGASSPATSPGGSCRAAAGWSAIASPRSCWPARAGGPPGCTPPAVGC
jgi:tetratricopeptide (TPR) repeat protein